MKCSRCHDTDPNCYVCHEPRPQERFKNPRPVVGSFLKKLQEAGFTLVDFYNGSRWLSCESGSNRNSRQSLKSIIVEQGQGLIRVYNRDSVSRLINVSIHRRPENFARVECGEEVKDVVAEFKQSWNNKPWPNS